MKAKAHMLARSLDLTYRWEVLQHCALHGQLVQVCIQKGENSLWEDRFRFAHDMSILRRIFSDDAMSLEGQPFQKTTFTVGSKRESCKSRYTTHGIARNDVN